MYATIAEIRRGVLQAPAGRKRDQLEAWFAGPEGPSALFAGRVLPFDEAAGLVWAQLMAEGTAKVRPRNALDTIIAATADANNCVASPTMSGTSPTSSSSIRFDLQHDRK